ncbi:MAG: major tail protein [Clostridium sp.]|uniref:major tail protein n=1 Tax=Clostridium sp. TaxID=1506 RepID=UPI003F2F7208
MTQSKMPLVNVDKIYFAKLTGESSLTATYDVPKYFPLIKQIQIKPKGSSSPFYAEGRKIGTLDSLQDIDVLVNLADLIDEEEQYLLGSELAEEGGVISNTRDHAPTVACLIESTKLGGKKRYIVLYAGNFSPYDDEMKDIEGGKPTFQTKKLKASFRPLECGKWKWRFDEDSVGVTSELIERFFKEVIIPTGKKQVVEQPTAKESK